MKPSTRSGALSETSLVDILDSICQSGQTAAITISVPLPTGEELAGAFYVEGGTLTDALFNGEEGADAVRQALTAQLGTYQVELGTRSLRRTVHESWAAISGRQPLDRPAPPRLYPVEGGGQPTPPPAPLPRLTPQRPAPAVATPPALPPTHSGAHRVPPKAPAARPATQDGMAAAAPATPPPQGVPAAAPATSGPRPLHTSGPTTSPFSGPHTPPPRGHPAAPTAPFSSVRKDAPRTWLLRAVLFLVLALVLGTGGAVLLTRVVNTSALVAPAAPAAAPAAATAVAPAVPAVVGVTDTEITLGMAAPFTGVSKELGRQMRMGVETAFARANAAGGVNGRQVKLIALDDGYEPSRTKDVMKELVEQRGVFGFIGNVGTPTAVVAVPYALEHKMLFFGPFTGAGLLRKDPPDRYVFNYRASYGEETAAIVRYLVDVRHIKPEQIAVFAQDDAYGDAGFQGVSKVLRQIRHGATSPILKVTYTRNTADVSDAVARILDKKVNVAAVVMVATYRPAARFIEKVREQRPGMVFTNVSFVGSQALAEELVQLGPQYVQGVIITQVVPLPTGQSTVGMRYREALAQYAPEEKPDFISLEGFVAGNVFLEGLKLAGRNVTTDRLVDALESIHGLDIGLGVPLNYGLSEHQASHKVWGTVLDSSGLFQQLELE